MRCWRGVNERVALPLLQELLGVLEHCSFVFVIWRRKIDKRFPQHAAHTRSFSLFRRRVFEVVHIREGSHSRAYLFSRCESRPPANELLRNILLFSGKDVFVKPVVEGYIVVQTAEEGHRNVGMTVDESREHQRVFRIDGLSALVLRFQFGARADRDNRVACNYDGPVVVDVPPAVHGDDGAASDDCVGALLRRLSIEKNREANVKRTEQREDVFGSHPWSYCLSAAEKVIMLTPR